MTPIVEWALNPSGEVLLAVSPPSPARPVDFRVTPYGFDLRRDDGSWQRLYPDLQVLSTLANRQELLVVEASPDGRIARETALQGRARSRTGLSP